MHPCAKALGMVRFTLLHAPNSFLLFMDSDDIRNVTTNSYHIILVKARDEMLIELAILSVA